MNSDTELDAFKREIDLRQFAASLGYAMDRRESWRGSTVLRRGGDKIVVKRNHNGHYVFFSVRDDSDHGTIIDFLQRRRHLTLGAVRQTLRPWIGRPAAALPWLPKLEPTGPDRMRVEREYQRMRDAPRHPYLEYDRCLPAALLMAPRFAGRVRIDRRGNAVFPHFDGAGLCGYEIQNQRLPVLPPAATRACGSRTVDRRTGVWSWPKAPLTRSLMQPCSRMPRTKPAMPVWGASPIPGSQLCWRR